MNPPPKIQPAPPVIPQARLVVPQKKKGFGIVAMAIICVLTVGMIIVCYPSADDLKSGATASLTSPVKVDSAKQQGRRELIQKLINRKIFTKVQYGNVPRVYVDNAFYLLKVDQKRDFISVVCAYAQGADSTVNTCLIYDGYSGKKIGDFTESFGLDLK